MNHRHAISDAGWDRIKHHLRGQRGRHGGVATRYEKRAANFLAFVKVAAIMVMFE